MSRDIIEAAKQASCNRCASEEQGETANKGTGDASSDGHEAGILVPPMAAVEKQ